MEQDFRIEQFTARVISSQKHTQSHVQSSGGGGYVGKYGGYVKSSTVSSYNTTQHEIFLLLENGEEKCVSLPFDNIQLRDQHTITLFSAFNGNEQHGWYVGLYNHNTKDTFNLLNDFVYKKLIKFNIDTKKALSTLIPSFIIAVPLLIIAMFSSEFSFMGGFLGVLQTNIFFSLIYFLIKSHFSNKKSKKVLKSLVEGTIYSSSL
ncbi:hypothetical protein [Hymenobacter rubripertinctus]|uniref:hypothetical protein n=1 Tax=Hymenobacter rubripertinctus TaxID=2029981 RepID=UPI0011C3D96C|nr:hypothetical protein [Hymenobacter rubripertinctus]